APGLRRLGARLLPALQERPRKLRGQVLRRDRLAVRRSAPLGSALPARLIGPPRTIRTRPAPCGPFSFRGSGASRRRGGCCKGAGTAGARPGRARRAPSPPGCRRRRVRGGGRGPGGSFGSPLRGPAREGAGRVRG